MVDRSNYCATNIESHLDPNLGRFRFPWKSVMSVRTQQSIRPDLLSSCSPYHSPCLSPLMLLALTSLTVCSLLFLYDKGVSPDMARSKKYRQAARCFCVTVLCCLVSGVFVLGFCVVQFQVCLCYASVLSSFRCFWKDWRDKALVWTRPQHLVSSWS